MPAVSVCPNVSPIFRMDQPITAKDVKAARELLDHLNTAPLSSRPVAALGRVGLGNGEWAESYEFIVVRRFRSEGELIVGGENGELFNVSAFVWRTNNLAELQASARG